MPLFFLGLGVGLTAGACVPDLVAKASDWWRKRHVEHGYYDFCADCALPSPKRTDDDIDALVENIVGGPLL